MLTIASHHAIGITSERERKREICFKERSHKLQVCLKNHQSYVSEAVIPHEEILQ
jgi:hypothetical protein